MSGAPETHYALVDAASGRVRDAGADPDALGALQVPGAVVRPWPAPGATWDAGARQFVPMPPASTPGRELAAALRASADAPAATVAVLRQRLAAVERALADLLETRA